MATVEIYAQLEPGAELVKLYVRRDWPHQLMPHYLIHVVGGHSLIQYDTEKRAFGARLLPTDTNRLAPTALGGRAHAFVRGLDPVRAEEQRRAYPDLHCTTCHGIFTADWMQWHDCPLSLTPAQRDAETRRHVYVQKPLAPASTTTESTEIKVKTAETRAPLLYAWGDAV